MEFNPEYFSYGVGLPIVGWACGMVVRMVIKIIERAL